MLDQEYHLPLFIYYKLSPPFISTYILHMVVVFIHKQVYQWLNIFQSPKRYLNFIEESKSCLKKPSEDANIIVGTPTPHNASYTTLWQIVVNHRLHFVQLFSLWFHPRFEKLGLLPLAAPSDWKRAHSSASIVTKQCQSPRSQSPASPLSWSSSGA